MANFSIATVFVASISLLLALTHSFSLENPTDRRILVLVDDLALKSSHSIFFNSLQARGFELDFKLSDDPKIALQRYGQHLYDGLILFSPTTERNFSILLLTLSFIGELGEMIALNCSRIWRIFGCGGYFGLRRLRQRLDRCCRCECV